MNINLNIVLIYNDVYLIMLSIGSTDSNLGKHNKLHILLFIDIDLDIYADFMNNLYVICISIKVK